MQARTAALLRRFLRSYGRFTRCETGGASVEFALWMPFILVFKLFVADVSFVLMRQASLLDVSRETARVVARHALDQTAAVQYAVKRAGQGVQNSQVLVEIDTEAAQVTVTILVEIYDLAPMGVLESMWINSDPITIQTVHRLEPI